MNNYAFIWGSVLTLLIALLTIFGFIYKNKSNGYKELEDKIVEAEKKYVDAKFLYPTNNGQVKTSASDLIKNGYMDELKKDDEVCDGYVVVTHKNSVYDYKGYVKCKNYETKGYNK